MNHGHCTVCGRPRRLCRDAARIDAAHAAAIAEAEAMEERDRLAGGPPWEVADHPDNNLPGGWHHGQLTGNPAPGWNHGEAPPSCN